MVYGHFSFRNQYNFIMLPFHRKDIEKKKLECRKLRNYPVFTALSAILKIHGIVPEYKYYAIFLKYP